MASQELPTDKIDTNHTEEATEGKPWSAELELAVYVEPRPTAGVEVGRRIMEQSRWWTGLVSGAQLGDSKTWFLALSK